MPGAIWAFERILDVHAITALENTGENGKNALRVRF